MYIPAAPWCPRNERYARSVLSAFEAGDSPGDFPEEHYEHTWDNRFHVEDLNDYGRQAFGLSTAASWSPASDANSSTRPSANRSAHLFVGLADPDVPARTRAPNAVLTA